MFDVIGRIQSYLGEYGRARPLLDEALAIRRKVRGESHADVATSLGPGRGDRSRRRRNPGAAPAACTTPAREWTIPDDRRLFGSPSPYTVPAT
jgi:hypothetical protein